MMNHNKYKPRPAFQFPERTWPEKQITKAPVWCSVDLRDGNQALPVPMSLEQKLDFFKFLVKIGFKEIEVAFPAASDTEFTFTRRLIEGGIIPDDVAIQVLTQSRDHIIERTFESLRGAKKAIVHLYNATSPLHRNVAFQMSKEQVKEMAVRGAEKFVELAEKYGRERFLFEYSPETFTSTEMDYAAEVCNAVLDVWQPTPDRKVVINLPATVEGATANVYADQIEYMCRSLKYRENIIVSLHAHNDRGCAVAATELAVMAGADRVEGTLFGNGERTGNADILTLAMNLYTQGIDPMLDFSHISDVVETYERSTLMPVSPRQPYAGELVFCAFSGSHQDAIRKGMAQIGESYEYWEVPYLPIDPTDVGRTYEAVVRINSQSGKGGVAYILEQKYGISMPKPMQQEFGNRATQVSDSNQKELIPEEIQQLFYQEYVNLDSPLSLVRYQEKSNGETTVTAGILLDGMEKSIQGSGNGLLDAFCNAISQELNIKFDIKNYNEHSLEDSSTSKAITYMQISDMQGHSFFGAGISSSISKSSLKAVVSAVNRMLQAYR